MKKIEGTFHIEAEPAAVLETIRNPKMIEASEKSRDALEVDIKDLTKNDDLHKFQIHVVSYAKGVKGIDKSKTEKSFTEVSWNLKDMTGTWVWNGPHGPKVNVGGGYSLKAAGNGTDLHLKTDIDISIPLVGKVVEAKVASEFQKGWPKYIDTIKQWIGK